VPHHARLLFLSRLVHHLLQVDNKFLRNMKFAKKYNGAKRETDEKA
jgi:hypothetical protein